MIDYIYLWKVCNFIINWIDIVANDARFTTDADGDHEDAYIQPLELVEIIKRRVLPLFTQRITHSMELGDKSKTLLCKMHLARSCLATDPRDKVYALISLSSSRERYLQAISYSDDVESVYRQFSRIFMESGEAVQLLYQVDSRMSPTLPLPSWIPVSPFGCCHQLQHLPPLCQKTSLLTCCRTGQGRSTSTQLQTCGVVHATSLLRVRSR